MPTRPSEPSRRGRRNRTFVSLTYASALFVLFCSLPLVGCASPGDPMERKPPVPSAIADLAAEQSGNDVVLTCTIPKDTVDHDPLSQSPAIEIYRAIHAAPGAASAGNPATKPAAPALVVTIPSAVVGTYIVGDHFRYLDTLTAGDFLPGDQQGVATYVIRARSSPKKESADSNHVDLNIFPAPNPIADLQTQAAQSGIVLTWNAPQTTLTGSTPVIAGYHIYRANAQTPTTSAAVSATNTANAEVTPNSTGSPGTAAAATPQTSAMTEIGESTTPTYSDSDAQFDKTYVYSVRSTMQTPGKLLESADSNLATLTFRDVFPPGAPTQLIATPVPTEEGLAAHIDLSWAINPETDLGGYNVYRSGQAGAPGTRINPQLLPTPAFRDMNATPGQSYFYRVTAVDRTGNESAASSAVQASLPATARQAAGSQPTP
jgi:hypothetical protein